MQVDKYIYAGGQIYMQVEQIYICWWTSYRTLGEVGGYYYHRLDRFTGVTGCEVHAPILTAGHCNKLQGQAKTRTLCLGGEIRILVDLN